MKRVALVACVLACSPEYVVWRARDVRVVERGGAQRVVVGSRALHAHDAIGASGISIARDHVAYAARDGTSWRVFVDDRAMTGAWDAIGAIALSDAGKLLYAAERDHRWFIGPSSEPFDAVAGVGFDGERVVFGAKQKGIARVTIDGRASHPWRDVRDLVISPPSYVGIDNRGEHFVDETTASDAFPEIVETATHGFVAKTDSHERVAYAFGKPVARGEPHLLTTAGTHFALASLEHGADVVVHDGARDPERFARVALLSLSPDGVHYGYVAERGTKDVVVVVDGARVGTFDWARAPVFDARGGYAFVAGIGSGSSVHTSRGSHATFDVVLEDSLVTTDDGAHWAIVAGYASVKRLYVVVDGRPRAPFDLDALISQRARDDATVRAIVRADLSLLVER